jgi:hypothetical protein
LIRTASLLTPLVIGEFVKDAEKRWRYIRMASIGSTPASEALWAHKIHKEREQAHERELECEQR